MRSEGVSCDCAFQALYGFSMMPFLPQQSRMFNCCRIIAELGGMKYCIECLVGKVAFPSKSCAGEPCCGKVKRREITPAGTVSPIPQLIMSLT